MKKIFLAIALLLSVVSFGQGKAPSFTQPNWIPLPHTLTGQMLNITNPYTGLLVLDSLAASASVYFWPAYGGVLAKILPIAAVDTFVPWPVSGYGVLDVNVTCTKISGSPAIKGTLWESPNGSDVFPIMSSTTIGTQDTFTVANISGAQLYTWHIPVKSEPYPIVHFVATSATQLSTCKIEYFFTQNAQVQY